MEWSILNYELIFNLNRSIIYDTATKGQPEQFIIVCPLSLLASLTPEHSPTSQKKLGLPTTQTNTTSMHYIYKNTMTIYKKKKTF